MLGCKGFKPHLTSCANTQNNFFCTRIAVDPLIASLESYLVFGDYQVSQTLHGVFFGLFKLVLGLIPKRSVTIWAYCMTSSRQLNMETQQIVLL